MTNLPEPTDSNPEADPHAHYRGEVPAHHESLLGHIATTFNAMIHRHRAAGSGDESGDKTIRPTDDHEPVLRFPYDLQDEAGLNEDRILGARLNDEEGAQPGTLKLELTEPLDEETQNRFKELWKDHTKEVTVGATCLIVTGGFLLKTYMRHREK